MVGCQAAAYCGFLYFNLTDIMILFEEDFDRYPQAIVDYETPNKSFVELAATYREMGVKNHNFILALHNPSLQGVDPFSPDITAAQALDISLECKENFWYFIREIARDPAGSDEFPLRIQINRGLVAAYWMYFNAVMLYLIMIRQTGKSFGLDWLWEYLANIRLTKSDISLLTLNEKLRSRQVERLKAMELAMPFYLKQRKKTDAGNTEVIRISHLENAIKLYISNRAPKIADTIGRGMTSANNGFDEFAYIPNNSIVVGVMLTASNAAREVARIKNEPYGAVFATTSGKRDTPEGGYAYKQVNDAAEFNEAMFDAKNREDLYTMIKANTKRKDYIAVNVTMNHRQLGKTDEWLKQRIIESTVTDPVQIRADYFNEWPKGGHSDVFSQDELEKMRASQVDDPNVKYAGKGRYKLNWYISDEEAGYRLHTEPTILTIDPSEALGSDGIGLLLTSIHTGEVIAAANITIALIPYFCEFIADFLIENPRVLFLPERKSTGLVIAETVAIILIRRGIDPFRRIFNMIAQECDEKKERYQDIVKNGKSEDTVMIYKKFFGYATSGSGSQTRELLYGRILRKAVEHGAHVMRDKTLIDQTSSLEIINYRIDHRDGEHDDLVIAWTLAFWAMLEGNNLRHYGIEPSEILCKNKIQEKKKTELSDYDRMVHERARAKVEELINLLSSEQDDYIANRIEQEIELNVSKLCQEDRTVFAKDDMLNRLKEQRFKNRRGSSYSMPQGNQSMQTNYLSGLASMYYR